MNNSYCQYGTNTDISLLPLSLVYSLKYALESRYTPLLTVLFRTASP